MLAGVSAIIGSLDSCSARSIAEVAPSIASKIDGMLERTAWCDLSAPVFKLVMPGLGPGIRVYLILSGKTWMAGHKRIHALSSRR